MRRTLSIAACAVALLTLVAEAQSGGYQLVRDWMKMPKGFIFGIPQGVPSPAEREAMAKRGERAANISAFAGVAVDQQDNVYAFHRGLETLKERFPPDLRTREHPVVVWDSKGNFKRWMGDGIPGGILGPHMLEVDPEGQLWIIERDDHRVIRLNKDGNTPAWILGEAGKEGWDETHLNRPTDVAWSKNGDIFITDGYGNHRVMKFSKDYKFIKQWGGGPDTKGNADGQFDLPHSISIDWQDKLYVLDRENHRIQMFDTEGKFLGKWDICNCWGIAIKKDGGKDGIMFMTDHANEQVMKVSMKDGKELARWGSQGQAPGQFDWAHDIAVDSQGAVYVSDTYGQKIQKFVDGKMVSMLGGRHGDGMRWLPVSELAHVKPQQLLRRPEIPISSDK